MEDNNENKEIQIMSQDDVFGTTEEELENIEEVIEDGNTNKE